MSRDAPHVLTRIDVYAAARLAFVDRPEVRLRSEESESGVVRVEAERMNLDPLSMLVTGELWHEDAFEVTPWELSRWSWRALCAHAVEFEVRYRRKFGPWKLDGLVLWPRRIERIVGTGVVR